MKEGEREEGREESGFICGAFDALMAVCWGKRSSFREDAGVVRSELMLVMHTVG